MPKIKKEYVIVATLAVALLAVIVIPVMYACGRANNADEQSHEALLKVGAVKEALVERIQIVDDHVETVAASLDTHFKVREVQDKADTERAERTEKTVNRIAEKLDIIPLAGGE